MLKNISNKPVKLKWGGIETVLKPGQSCRYLDPFVEGRMKMKFPGLEHSPEKLKPQEKVAQVIISDIPAEPQENIPQENEAVRKPRGRPRKAE